MPATALFLGLALALTFSAWTARASTAEASTPQSEEPAYDTSSMLIGLSPDTELSQLEEYLAVHALELVHHWPDLNIAHVRLREDLVLPADQNLDAFAAQSLDSLEASAQFRFVEFDGLVQIAARQETEQQPPELEPAPNDALAPDQYALDIIGAREAWNITHGNPAIAVAVIDTGYASQHEDIAFDNVWRNSAEYGGLPNIDDDANGYIDDIHGWNWFNNNNNPEDANGHGTHIFGTIAARTNNGTGVAGFGRSIRVAPLRIFGPTGAGSISNLVAALDYAVQQNIPIVNLSLTTASDSPALREAVERAAEEGILVIAASGNMPVGASFTAVQYPAVYAGTLAVAATTAGDEWAGFSRYGPAVDVSAPGDSILSTYINDQYRSISGTSMATAHVSALAALIMSLRPDLDAQGVRNLITATAVDVNADAYPGKDPFLGAGRIDMATALLEASRALTITADGLNISQGGELSVRVTAPPAGGPGQARLPVVNAMLHYRHHPAEGEPATEWQRLPTGLEGYVNIPLSPEEASGQIELQVGAITHTVQVTPLPQDSRLTLDFETETTTVGSTPLSYTLALRDGAGNLIRAGAAVEISSNFGSFENSSGQMTVNLVDGQYQGTWTPGTVSGSAHINAILGPHTSTPYTATATVTVWPDKPYKIKAPAKVFPEVSISANSVQLDFQVEDRFGNPVRDGTEVTLFTSTGILDAAVLQTRAGKATATIRLPQPQTQTVSVWAVVPAGPLEIRVDIPPKRVRTWLPSLQTQIPMGQQ